MLDFDFLREHTSCAGVVSIRLDNQTTLSYIGSYCSLLLND
jgi:hypothetical protein